MTKITLPYRHYYYLKILSSLRRESVEQAIEFLYANLDDNSDNWIDTRFAHYDKPSVDIDITNIKTDVNEASLMRKIQALPPGIKPITDGPYSVDVRFEKEGQYVAMHILGYKIYDFGNPAYYDGNEIIYRLVKDKFPFSMSMDEYYLYRMIGSQFWRLIQERDQHTMPSDEQTAMDVGAYVGFRALAMHYCVGSKGKVYAIEAEDENFELLKKNVEVNNLKNIIPLQEAVDSLSRDTIFYTKDKKSMSHSLRPFESIEDPSLVNATNSGSSAKQIHTIMMDALFEKYSIKKVDVMHISVAGHEIEVLNGINSILPQLKRVRVSCPYKTDGTPNIVTAKEKLEQKGFSNFNIHGSAIIGEK